MSYQFLTSNLSKAHEMRESLQQFLFACNRSLSPSIHFVVIHSFAAKNRQKITLNQYF